MSSPTAATEPCKILSLDGGGIRGLSSLLILEEIMESIKESEKLSEIPRPCDRFDLLGGTGTGGIIALMLGRLKMTVDQCIRTYKKLAKTAFTTKRRILVSRSSAAFSAVKFQNAIKLAIRENCIEPNCVEQRRIGKSTANTCPHEDLPLYDESCPKTAVLAITKDNIETLPTLLTTYDSSTRFSRCKAWEAARATSAAVAFFKPAKFGRDNIEFIDASFGHNNPCESLIMEAKKQFPGRQLLVLSLGTGLGDVIPIGNRKASIMAALREMSISSKATHLRLRTKYEDTGIYYRFNVENGVKNITLSDWKQGSEVSSHTVNYIEEKKASLAKFVRVITASSTSQVSMPQTTPQVPTQVAEPSSHQTTHYIPFPPNSHFVGREDALSTLNDKLFSQTSIQSVALVGFGGIGKTQVALEFAHWVKKNKPGHSVFWLTVASMTSFHDACGELAKTLEINVANEQDPKILVRDHLESNESGKWLLILDDLNSIEAFDSTKIQDRIAPFLPQSERGRTIISTRSIQVARLTIKAQTNIIKLEEMPAPELAVILERSTADLDDETRAQDKALIDDLLEELCHLPLAAAQAAHYISTHQCSIADYLDLLRTSEKCKFRLLGKRRADQTHHGSQSAVATTWISTFQQIQKVYKPAATLLEFISYIQPTSIPLSIFPEFERPEQMTEAVSVLLGYGFLRKQKTSKLFDMKNLVHLAAQMWYGSPENGDSQVTGIIAHLTSLLSGVTQENDMWRQYVPHALRVLEKQQANSVHASNLAFQIGSLMLRDGNIQQAIRIFKYAVAIDHKFEAVDDPSLPTPRHALAREYLDQGQVEKAIPVLESIIAMEEEPLATEDAPALNNSLQ